MKLIDTSPVGPGHARTDPADSVTDRVEALRAFLNAVADHLPESLLTTARLVVDRAGQRLGLSQQHTVVALAGASGSGKSSLFNTLAKLGLSHVGSRRPTTAVAHACVWSTGTDERLLDWLGVPPSLRFTRESALDGQDEASLRGLVLLDLPDFDSVEDQHRIEVDRLLTMVDLVVWVLDPQKYADHVVHHTYLSRFRRHRDITLVLLNQADLLRPADRNRCLADLRQLLDAEGLDGTTVLATSTIGAPGTAELRAVIEGAVAARQAALRRLDHDLDAAIADLEPLVEGDITDLPVSLETMDALSAALAAMAEVPSLVEAGTADYRSRGLRAMRWPAPTLTRTNRPDHTDLQDRTAGVDRTDGTDRAKGSAPVDPETGGVGPSDTAEDHQAAGDAPTAWETLDLRGPQAYPALVAMAARILAEGASAGLPAPWPAAITAAARSRLDDLAAALEAALNSPDVAPPHPTRWWRLVGVGRWLCVLVTVWGLANRMNALILGGVAGVFVLTLVGRVALRMSTGRVRTHLEEQLRVAVSRVGRDLIEAPVRKVLRSYTAARVALAETR